ncbi:hypothetical protein Cfor_02538, partial [Coptotermes formosanus]
MQFWLLTVAAAGCFLGAASATCINNPCTGTDYRSYSSCLSHQCPNTVVATGCPESKCTSIDCNTCSSSSTCCHSCCRPKCECSSVSCNTCPSSSACCNTCCPKQDCCTSKKREECCTTQPDHKCCKETTPVSPVFPSITLPNITIVINQSAPVVYNTMNQTCGGVTTVRNSTHIVTTTSTCTNQTNPRDPCCTIVHQPPCPNPVPPYYNCPPPVHNYACGPQCIVQPQVLIPPPPQVIQPMIQPPVIAQPPPVFAQPPPVIAQPPTLIAQPPTLIAQPPTLIAQQPTLIAQPPSVAGCYAYPVNQCPQHCYGHCHWPRYSGCVPVHQWPFIRCGYGGPYVGGIGGIGGYGGYAGQGGYAGYGSYGAGAQPF